MRPAPVSDPLSSFLSKKAFCQMESEMNDSDDLDSCFFCDKLFFKTKSLIKFASHK